MRSSFARRFGLRSGVWLFVFAVCAATAGGAEPLPSASRAEPAGELTLAHAIDAALGSNPDLAASAFELSAAEARILQARLRLNPELDVELENFAGSRETQGTDALESTVSLSQVIELGGKRGLRTDVASADRDFVGTERQAQQLDVLAEVARRFIAVAATQDRLALATSTKEVAQRTLDAITARVQAARSPLAERSRASIALTRATVEEQQAQSELRSARVALSALWGSVDPRFTAARADLLSLNPVQPFESFVTRLEGNPDFLLFASEARLRDAQLRLARAQARPNVVFGAGLRRLSQTSDTAFVASFSIPLPISDRNQGAIREAQVRRAQNSAAREAAFVRARATVYGLYQELIASRTRVEMLRTEALPQAERALDETQYGYERGRFSYLELATSQQELLDLRATLIGAAADYHRFLAELERLTGEPVSVAAP